MRLLNIICLIAVLVMSAIMVFPLLILLGEFLSGNRRESFIYELLTNKHHEFH